MGIDTAINMNINTNHSMGMKSELKKMPFTRTGKPPICRVSEPILRPRLKKCESFSAAVVLLVSLWPEVPSAFADDEVCATCGPEVSVSGDFAHRKDDASVVIEGTVNDGDEVAQVYFRHVNSVVPQPKLALCGFQRVSLKRGESKTITIEVPAERLRYWDMDKKQYVVELGKYEFLIGASSDDIRLKLPMTITAR
jgi:hypothetical protein